jgi:hypothetical protein
VSLCRCVVVSLCPCVVVSLCRCGVEEVNPKDKSLEVIDVCAGL